MQHLGAEVCQPGRLPSSDPRYRPGAGNEPGRPVEDAVDVGPDLDAVALEGGPEYRGAEVGCPAA